MDVFMEDEDTFLADIFLFLRQKNIIFGTGEEIVPHHVAQSANATPGDWLHSLPDSSASRTT